MNKPKTVWIFQTGEPLSIDGEGYKPLRLINLINNIKNNYKNSKIVVFSSVFNHQTKKKRKERIFLLKGVKYILINSPGYKNNVSIYRFIDHWILGINLGIYLIRNFKNKPDFAFIGNPPVEFAFVASRFLILKKVPFILDVKDLWPEYFYERFSKNLKVFLRIIFLPMEFMCKSTIKNAKLICSISPEFLHWVQGYGKRGKNKTDFVCYLTNPEIKLIDKKYKDDSFTISYIGSLSNSAIDISFVKKFVNLLNKKDIGYKMIIAGEGPLSEEILHLEKNNKNINFVGIVSEKKVTNILRKTSLILAPYPKSETFEKSIPNKIQMSLAYGIPILTTLNGSTKKIIEKYNLGLYTKSEKEAISFIQKLKSSQSLKKIIFENCRFVYKKEFNHSKNYDKLSNYIFNL